MTTLERPEQTQGSPRTAACVVKARQVTERTLSVKPPPFQLAKTLRGDKKKRSFEDDDVDCNESINC